MSLFSIGVSGLNTAQIALRTTSNNITNVYSPGYNREVTLLKDNSIGGVLVEGVERRYDYFVASQLNSARSELASLTAYDRQISQIDNMLADTEVGLAPMMQKFFAAFQDLTAAPSDSAARQAVVGAADTLSTQLRNVDGQLRTMQADVNTQIRNEVSQINETAELIAKLNLDIALASSRGGESPNALMNERDRLLGELSERVDVRLLIQDGSYYNISIGNGQALVAGGEAFKLAAGPSSTDAGRIVVGYEDTAGNVKELKENTFNGGVLGGLFEFRAETLDKVQNQLGLLAVSLGTAVNEQHQLGVDLNGDPGGEFFAFNSPAAYSSRFNIGTANFTAEFSDVADLTGTDYDIRVSDAANGEFTVTPRAGGDAFTATLNGANQLSFDGMLLTVDDPAALANGDRFLLQPTRNAAAVFENLIDDSSTIAAGLGGGSGDNRNALAMQDIQTSNVVRGNATLNQAYGSMVSFVGNQTSIVQINLTAQEGMTEQLRAVQLSESGVNLDEEAANLIRYQQYYQASARIVDVAGSLLESILAI